MKEKFKKNYVTYSLIFINIAYFIFMLFRYGSTTNAYALIKAGAKFNFLMINNNEWWRLITASFIHIGFPHLLVNMVTILFAGTELEDYLGHWRFLVIYIIAGIGGTLCSFAFSPDNISAGASTSAFGLFTAFIALAYIFPNSYGINYRAKNFLILVIFNLISGIFETGIDNFGHIGGGIFGFLMTLIVGSQYQKSNKKYITISLVLIFVISLSLLKLGIYNFNN